MPDTRPHRSAVRLLSALLGLALAALAAQPGMAQTEARAHYVVTLGGINIASAEIGFREDGRRYGMELTASVSGLGSLVASGTATASSSGAVSNPSLVSEEFGLTTRAQGETFAVDIAYSGRDVTAFRVTPPVLDSYDRVAIERAHLTGVNDMLAAFVVRADALDESLCRRSLRIFTGVERFDLDMAFGAYDEATSPRTGYQGPVVLCTLSYRPVSGHFRSSEITDYLARSNRILIWYAPLGQSGYFIPYRALVGTSAGDLSMVLTALRP